MVLATGTGAVMPPIPGLADVKPVGQPGHHLRQGAAAPAARARRWRDRRGDGAGLQAPRMRGGHRRRGRAPRCSLARSRSRATRCDAAFAEEGIVVHAGVHATAVRREGSDGPIVLVARRRHRDRGRPASRLRRSSAQRRRISASRLWGSRRASSSRSTTVCARWGCPASGSTRSATATGVRLLTHMGKYQAPARRRRHPRQGRRRRRRPRHGAAGDVHRPPGVRRRDDRGPGAREGDQRAHRVSRDRRRRRVRTRRATESRARRSS